MRLLKFTCAMWYDEHWFHSFSVAWKYRAYWWDYHRPRPWVESLAVGPLRLDVHGEGNLAHRPLPWISYGKTK